MCHWCLIRGHVIRDCKAKAAGKPKATKSTNSLELEGGSGSMAAGDWTEDLPLGYLLRDCNTLEHDEEWSLDAKEMGQQDWLSEQEVEQIHETTSFCTFSDNFQAPRRVGKGRARDFF